ncbi:MAG: hypothetical protein WDZ72_12525, partial [Cyclobacteriaceae bacterium]
VIRTKGFSHDEELGEVDVSIGKIKIIRTASFESLDNPQRNSTQIVFFDAVEPKKNPQDNNPLFPDTIDVSYRLEALFKEDHGENRDEPENLNLTLPITSPPVQVPKIASAGLALSPYVRDEKYANSESRKRFLWIEFSEPIEDPQDTYFARVLANSPDQLISNNHPSLFVGPEEPPLPIDPEQIRIITPASSNDLAGLKAMQPMIKSTTSDLHYLLPLPPGLHAHSDEMFGFFAYEFRVGHYQRPAQNDDETPALVWSTAQGRFGRRLKSYGIQHPAPALTCMPNRDNHKLWVTAPYAVAVHKGKNVTADPPRTELWALLYAQVKQADNKDYRNILLDDRPLDWRVQIEPEEDVNLSEKYTQNELQLLNQITIKIMKGQVSGGTIINYLKIKKLGNKNKNATKYGTTVWSNKKISQLLTTYGLPKNASLSVIVVETLPQINNIFEHMSGLEKPQVAQTASNLMSENQKVNFNQEFTKRNRAGDFSSFSAVPQKPSPVSDELGHHRIYRATKLTAVNEVCCTDC